MAPTQRIFLKLDISEIFEKLSRKYKFYLNLTRIMGTLHENLCTFMVLSRLILVRKKNVSQKFAEKLKTHISCIKTFSENRAAYEITWKNDREPDRPQVSL